MHKKTSLLSVIAIVALLSACPFIKANKPKTTVGRIINNIRQKAQEWVGKCINPMNNKLKQAVCNMLGASCITDDASATTKSFKIAQACAKYITELQESDELIKQAFEQLQQDIQELLTQYVVFMQEKLTLHKSATVDQDALNQVLEQKIHELIARISLIYYETLYNHMRSCNLDDQLMYMFDQNGIIAEDQRTLPLPDPAVIQKQFKQLMHKLSKNS